MDVSLAKKKVFTEQTVTVGELREGGYCPADANVKLNVYGALPGEELTVKPFSRRQRKIFARPTEIHSRHPHRVEPPCDVADICGGCSLQHLDPNEQILLKQRFVQENFGDIQPEVWFDPLRGHFQAYRAKARLGVKYVEKKQQVLVGFREKLKPFIVDTKKCHVLKSPVGEMLPDLGALVESLSVPTEIPQIEVAIGDNKIAMVFRHLQSLQRDDIEKFTQFGQQKNISIYLQPDTPDNIHRIYPSEGSDYLHYDLSSFDLTYEFMPLDFTQVNPSINETMVRRADELLQLSQTDEVLDAFCGIGNFSLALARSAGFVIGIESSEQSVIRARHNADLNGINNCVFIAQDLFAESIEIQGFQSINKVLLDPPRTGAESLCKKLASHKVERVVYVSCNPASLARDAKILVESGYKFEGAGVIDMFPHTTHVESIACFYR